MDYSGIVRFTVEFKEGEPCDFCEEVKPTVYLFYSRIVNPEIPRYLMFRHICKKCFMRLFPPYLVTSGRL